MKISTMIALGAVAYFLFARRNAATASGGTNSVASLPQPGGATLDAVPSKVSLWVAPGRAGPFVRGVYHTEAL